LTISGRCDIRVREVPIPETGHFGIYVETEPERLKEAEATLREAGAAEVKNER
jgi:hypothetical protein